MSTKRTHYEVLGVPRNATDAQIKRKYRQMVRKYHPDVAKDKKLAHKLFIQINDAYHTLSDPDSRRAYDAELDKQEAVSQSYSDFRTSAEYVHNASHLTISQHIKDAQWAFIQKRFQEAVSHCKEAISDNPSDYQAFVILGDVFRAQRKYNAAIRAYSNALQCNPNDGETEKKLSDVVRRQLAVEKKKKPKTVEQVERIRLKKPSARAAFSVIWWAVAFFLIMMIGAYPGRPITWLRTYIPQISGWSWNLVIFMSAASVVVGILLAVNGYVNHPDDELVFESGVIPTGVILLIGSGFFFLAAAAVYTIIGLIQGTLSKSVMTVFACVMAVVILAAMNYDPAVRRQVLLFGGNVTFLSCLLGWYIGAMMRPFGEY